MAIVHTWAHGSRRLLGSGHRTSSTLQAMFSPARYMRLYSSIHGQDSLYIFSQKSFDPYTVPLKWNPVELLHDDVVFSQDASDGGDAHMVYVVEHLPVCKYFRSWWRRTPLSAPTRSTMASFCCCVNRHWHSPPEGLLVILFSSRNVLITDATVIAQMWVDSLPSFPHSKAMVDDMVHQSCSYIIRNMGPCMDSSTLTLSSSSSCSSSASCSPSIHACKVLEMAKMRTFLQLVDWCSVLQVSAFRCVFEWFQLPHVFCVFQMAP